MKNQIQHTFTDETTKKSQQVTMALTLHAEERISERGFSEQLIFLVMEYGKEFFKQGLVFYGVLDKNLPNTLSAKLKKKLKNLVLVVDPNNAKIITMYRAAKNCNKYLSKKRKDLVVQRG